MSASQENKEYKKASDYLIEDKKANLGWLFYRDYYRESEILTGKYKFSSKNDKILERNVTTISPSQDSESSYQTVKLQTTYPGLLMGTGYNHEAKIKGNDDYNDAFKIGFYFDYTSGIPVLPGSSVKGVLRSAFPCRFKKGNKDFEKKEHFIKYLLDIIGIEKNIAAKIDIDKLENEIFNGIGLDKNGKEKQNSIYERDVFFDAVPIGTHNLDSKLLGEDYITPHIVRNEETGKENEEMRGLKNPTPIKFLKILPETVFEFRFRLQQSQHYPILTPAKKQELFYQILLHLGTGAKTNVGYGNWKDVNKPK